MNKYKSEYFIYKPKSIILWTTKGGAVTNKVQQKLN